MDIIDKLRTLNTKAIDKFRKDNPNIHYVPFNMGYYTWKYFVLNVFSKRKTVTTISDLVCKLTEYSKSVQNRKYLQSEIPYYVFPYHITDLEGNVLFMKYGKIDPMNNRNSLSSWLITSDFYNSNHPLANYIIERPHSFSLEIVNVKDIYEMFFKLYEFTSIKDINNFKAFAKNILEEKAKEINKVELVEEPF